MLNLLRRFIIGLIAFVVGLVFFVWLLWMPSATEPGYSYELSWGSKGEAAGQFNDPTSIAVTDTEVYVSDARNQRIQVFDYGGKFIRQFGNKGDAPGELGRPMSLSIANNELYVADYFNDRIQVFDAQGRFVRKWGGPLGMNIFGPFNGWFATVTSIIVGKQGNILVADFYNNRVQKFSAEGKFLSSFGEKGTGDGQFQKAIAVAEGADGSVFVADFLNNRIQKWKSKQKT